MIDRGYILRETAIAMVANGIVNTAFIFLIFGGKSGIPLWGGGGFAIDFIPQLMAITVVGSMVPALLTRRRLSKTMADPSALESIASLARWTILLGIGAVILVGGAVTAALHVLAPGPYSFNDALILKSLVGLPLPLVLTPLAIRRIGRVA